MGLPVADDLTIAVSSESDRTAARTALIKLGAGDLIDMLGLGDDHLLDGIAVAEPKVSPINAYRPHTALRVVDGIDWDALTPRCSQCGHRRGDVDLSRILCAKCAAPTKLKTTKAPKRPSERKPRPRIHVDENAVITRYLAREAMGDIAKTYGCSRQRIRDILTANAITIREPFNRENSSEFTDEQKAAIVHAYEHHRAIAQIAKDHTCSRVKIRSVITAAGIELPGRRRPAIDYTQAMKRYAVGERVDDIAADLGISPTSIRNKAYQDGIAHGNAVVVDPAIVVSDYESGMSFREVSKKHRISKDRAARLVRESGFAVRSKGHRLVAA